MHEMAAYLRLAAALQLPHWAPIKLGSRSKGWQPWLRMLARTLLWACTRRGCREAVQGRLHLGQVPCPWMRPAGPCWLPDATASEAKDMSAVAGHLLHTICKYRKMNSGQSTLRASALPWSLETNQATGIWLGTLNWPIVCIPSGVFAFDAQT